MSEELLPCPFCGGIADWQYQNKPLYDIKIITRFRVFCTSCGNETHQFVNQEHALAAWNARKESDELPEWFVNKLNESIIDCGLLEAELKDDNDIEEAVRVSRRANTLRWVLSLRKPEVKE